MAYEQVQTVKVARPDTPEGYMIINASDYKADLPAWMYEQGLAYDPAVYPPYVPPVLKAPEKEPVLKAPEKEPVVEASSELPTAVRGAHAVPRSSMGGGKDVEEKK